jgi:hypothetical protein
MTGAGSVTIPSAGTYTLSIVYTNGSGSSQEDSTLVINQNYTASIAQPTVTAGPYCVGSTYTINPSTVSGAGINPSFALKINGVTVSTTNTPYVWTPTA